MKTRENGDGGQERDSTVFDHFTLAHAAALAHLAAWLAGAHPGLAATAARCAAAALRSDAGRGALVALQRVEAAAPPLPFSTAPLLAPLQLAACGGEDVPTRAFEWQELCEDRELPVLEGAAWAQRLVGRLLTHPKLAGLGAAAYAAAAEASAELSALLLPLVLLEVASTTPTEVRDGGVGMFVFRMQR